MVEDSIQAYGQVPSSSIAKNSQTNQNMLKLMSND